ncbi:MAG: hypothetical protein ABL860_07515 [Candidatus Nitrotoga sp.]
MSHHEADDPRRRILIKALVAGMLTAGLPGANALAASFFGSRPYKLPPGQSIYRISGQATVNGKAVTMKTRINPGDTVETAKDSELIFIVNTHAMILREGSHLVIESGQRKSDIKSFAEERPGEMGVMGKKPNDKRVEELSPVGLFINGLRMLSGKLLTVSRNTPMRVRTATATIGIRGTGFYVEADPELTYFCTCYGTTDVVASDDPASNTTVVSQHHDRPLYIVKGEGSGNNIRKAPFINHTDQELAVIETLVDRTTPFIFANDAYSAPRRDY